METNSLGDGATQEATREVVQETPCLCAGTQCASNNVCASISSSKHGFVACPSAESVSLSPVRVSCPGSSPVRRAGTASCLRLGTLKPSLVPSCLFSWPTNGGRRGPKPPIPDSDSAGHLLYRTHPGHQPPDPSPAGPFAPRSSFKKAVVFGSSLGRGHGSAPVISAIDLLQMS